MKKLIDLAMVDLVMYLNARGKRTGELCAIKRVERLRFDAEGGKKEIDVLLHVRNTEDVCSNRISCYLHINHTFSI